MIKSLKQYKYKKESVIISLVCLIILGITYFVFNKVTFNNTPRDIVYQFLTSEDKTQYLLDGYGDLKDIRDEKFEESIKSFDSNIRDFVFEEEYYCNEVEDNEYTRVKVFKKESSGNSDDSGCIFYLKKVNGKFLIDLKPNLLKNEINIPDYLLGNDTEQKLFKVYASNDIYNFKQKVSNKTTGEQEDSPYNEVNKFYSIVLKDPETGFNVQGFIEKNSKESEYLYNYLKSGNNKHLIIKARKNEIKDHENLTLYIEEIISFDWSGQRENYNFRNW